MYHIRQCTVAEWDAWAVEGADEAIGRPEPRASTPAELLNRGVVLLDRGAEDVLYDCGVLDEARHAAMPGTALTPTDGRDAILSRRYRTLPAELKPRVYHATVYRATDGRVNLRAKCNEAVGKALEAKTPATSRTSRQSADPAGALDVLAEARRLAALATPEAKRLRVRMANVAEGDVVEEDALVPHAWAGEAA